MHDFAGYLPGPTAVFKAIAEGFDGIETLKRYFATFVFGKRVPENVTFREWLTPMQLNGIPWKEMLQLRNVGRSSVQRKDKPTRCSRPLQMGGRVEIG